MSPHAQVRWKDPSALHQHTHWRGPACPVPTTAALTPSWTPRSHRCQRSHRGKKAKLQPNKVPRTSSCYHSGSSPRDGGEGHLSSSVRRKPHSQDIACSLQRRGRGVRGCSLSLSLTGAQARPAATTWWSDDSPRHPCARAPSPRPVAHGLPSVRGGPTPPALDAVGTQTNSSSPVLRV